MSNKNKKAVKKTASHVGNYVQRVQAQQTYEKACLVDNAMQKTLDMVQITLHQFFGFGKDRQKLFAEKFKEVWEEHKKDLNEDYKDDKDLVYSEYKWEKILKEAVGAENYCPKEERYS